MAKKGWKQPYHLDGNEVSTRLSGEKKVVFVGETVTAAEEFWVHANCLFQVEAYGAVDAGLWFVSDALARGYKIPDSVGGLNSKRTNREPPKFGKYRTVQMSGKMPEDPYANIPMDILAEVVSRNRSIWASDIVADAQALMAERAAIRKTVEERARIIALVNGGLNQ